MAEIHGGREMNSARVVNLKLRNREGYDRGAYRCGCGDLHMMTFSLTVLATLLLLYAWLDSKLNSTTQFSRSHRSCSRYRVIFGDLEFMPSPCID